MVKSQKKIKIRPVASVLCGLQSEASEQWCQITWIIESKEPMNPSLKRIDSSFDVPWSSQKERTLSFQGRHVAQRACLHGGGSVLPKL